MYAAVLNCSPQDLEAWFSVIGSLGIRCADHKLMSKQWAYRVRFVFRR